MSGSKYKVKYDAFLPPKKIAANETFSLAVNDTGDLFAWGSNENERLGFSIEEGKYIENPKKRTFFTDNYYKVHEVSCGAAHIAVVVLKKDESADEAGYVFTWGLPFFGRLGHVDFDDGGSKQIKI